MVAHLSRYCLDLLRNLCAGLGLALGFPMARQRFVYRLGQLLSLLVLLLLADGLGDYLITEPPRSFSPFGLNFLAGRYLLYIVVLWLVCWIAGAGLQGMGRVGIRFFSGLLPISVCSYVLWLLDGSGGAALEMLLLFMLWEGGVLMRALRLLPCPWQQAVPLGLFGSALLLGSVWVLPYTPIWQSKAAHSTDPINPAYAVLEKVHLEDVFYAQPALLQSRLNSVSPGQPGVVDLYFLGLAGSALEKVFWQEVRYVQQQFAQQYGTHKRAMVLVNNPQTLQSHPLANKHNLRDSLRGFSARMNVKEDVLFLFMTSHGTQDHRLSMELGPIPLDDLTPQDIRTALDDAGILWRVIVVSSCYSGGFVEPLANEHTLVISAAAADRTSFGCGVESDFTYFGNAYFKQGLTQDPRFIQAFKLAKEWVHQREVAEGLTASQPQLAVGEQIRAQLEAFYQQSTIRPLDRPTNGPDGLR